MINNPRVEYRLLQFQVSALSGDHLTVALVHWDGSLLRVARSRTALAFAPEESRDLLAASLNEELRTVERAARAQEMPSSLSGFHFVRSGTGPALAWTGILSTDVPDPADHFESLVRELRLRKRDRKDRVTNQKLDAQLRRLGRELSKEFPEVLVDESVTAPIRERFPISWKNGQWHRAIPFSLDGLTTEQQGRLAQQTVGRVRLSVPASDVPVLIQIVPSGSEASISAKSVMGAVQSELGGRHVEIFQATATTPKTALDDLEARIREDVSAHH